MKIVSDNYRDPGGPEPYLIRDFRDDLNEAIPAASVYARGVQFCVSKTQEGLSGSKFVALCDAAYDRDPLPELRGAFPIRCKGFFQNPITGSAIPRCKELILRDDGSIAAVTM